MKKIVMLAVMAAGMVFSATAQESGFGIRASLNLSNVNNKYDGEVASGESKSDYEYDFKNRVGFNIGLIYDWGISESFYIQPGLYFTTRGAKIEESEEDYKYEEKWKLNYLQIPILASYRIALTDNVKWHINAGPYLAIGVGGKVKWEETYDGDTDKGDYKAFGTANEDSDEEKGGLKRFDAGLSFGTGVSINKFYIGLTYDLGLVNAADKDTWKDYKMRNRNFSIGVGYNF
ncbi:MAG: PorT family protein [Odoribacter splanchnicus]|nr:PorT family protein [Odoribacter splanchnicus]